MMKSHQEKTTRENKIKIQNIKIALIGGVFMILLINIPLGVNATTITSCSTGSGSSPIGVAVDSYSDVWFGLDSYNKLAELTSSSCSPSYKTITNGAHFLDVAGNGYIAYTMKGSGGSTNSCISAYNPGTGTVVNHVCATGKGFDDIAADPTNSHIVWVSAYYTGQIAKFDVTTGSVTYYSVPIPGGCSFTYTSPEGIRVDSYGNVWVADESCYRIAEYNSGGYWGTYSPGSEQPWFVSVDNTNNNLWMTSRSYDDVMYMDMSSGSTTSVGIPSSYGGSSPTGIDVDPADSRADVTFQGGGYVDEYSYSSVNSWLCGTGDSWGSTSNPFGIRAVAPNYYWTALQGSDKIAEGDC